MTFSEIVKTIRHECYLSQQAFADELGVSFSTVNRWENGRAIPSYKAMKKLIVYCKLLNIDCSEMEKIWKESKNGAYSH